VVFGGVDGAGAEGGYRMDFYDVLDRVVDLLRSRGRVSYRALKRQFGLDDAYLEDLKVELCKSQRLAVDEDGEVLVWTGSLASAPAAPPVTDQEHTRLAYTPKYLAEKILTTRAALEGERKQVTVLFADIKDSTELIKDLDPEAAQQLLDPAIHIMMDAVHRYEGTVNQVLGDGIMALFGAPIAHEDHPLRACYAALAMQVAMQLYAEEVRRRHGVVLRIRVGLNAGEVVVRAIGNDLHMDYSAVGQTVHLAARLEQLAPPGSILLTAATLRLVEGLVRVNALGPIPVKGLPEPVEVFELIGTSAIHRRLQAAATRGLTRFVGRQTELAALRQALERAGAGHGQAAAVVGEAGVGKSRLVYEFIHSHHTRNWLVLECASVSYGKATAYFPVVDLLKRYVHVDDGDDTRTMRAKVTGQVLTLDAALQETIPALLTLLDALPEDHPFLTLEPPQRRQRTLDALKRMLLRESQVQPVLLVCEDLHWIDAETQALLDSLVESLPTAQMLLLTNYRPEYQHGWGSKTYYTQLRLDPLPPESADEFLQALLGDDPSLTPLKQLLIARTEGNPFFLEESVRVLVETGVLVGERGVYRPAQALSTIQVPATVQAVLGARIDRLSAEEKHLLQTAAVIGNELSLPLLQAIAELPEDALHRGLAHLQAAEFLYETSLFPELTYTFKHALTRDVDYGGLLHERRRLLHGRVGVAMAELYAGRLVEYAETLAYHFEQGEVWAKAVHYLLSAAEKAKAQYAYSQAVHFCTRALEAAAHAQALQEDRVRGLALLGDLWSLMGNLEQANRSYVRALETTAEPTVQRWIVNKRHQSHLAIRNGVRIAFYEHGSGEPTLVFTNPILYGLATFQPVLERLCQEFRILTIDPRGSGASDPLQRPYTITDHMEDVRAVIEASWSGPVVGIGISRGGNLLVRLAVAYPALVQGLVMAGTPLAQQGRRPIDQAQEFLRNNDLEGAVRFWGSLILSEPGLEPLVEQFVKDRLAQPRETILSFFDPDPEMDIAPLLGAVSVPTLVMHGTEDRNVPLEVGRYLAGHIPGAQFYAFKGRGHVPVSTATAEFCDVLRCFVRTGSVSATEGAGN
jgi:class 3 adenylate cyclase/pimeloyl-ACP methyl ester carboxylesterase